MNPYPPPPSWAAEICSIGVTGTNGKSSTTRFVAAGLGARGSGPVAQVTTVGAGIDDRLGPPPADHRAFLALMATLHRAGAGERSAAIEATSAALGLGFARSWPFVVGVFTNLGHDHQRTHGSFEHYLASKAQLFVHLAEGGAAVLNAGDPCSSLIAEVLPPGIRALWFAGPGEAADRAVDLRVLAATPSWDGLGLELHAAPELGPIPRALRLRALASFQAANAAAALLACLAVGVAAEPAARAIAATEPPPGRFEPIHANGDRPRVIVDYAHTPEALATALDSARALCRGRLILVFGAGGGADASKRIPLGAAARAADVVWLTNDNPRDEEPLAIVEDLRAGLGDTPAKIEVELDRARAIQAAIGDARPDDLVVIAGKGHETEIEIAGQRLPSDDRALARAALESR